MEENKITWTNKVTLVARPDLPPQNKVTAADMNQVKAGLNGTIDELILVEGRVTTVETDITTAEGNITTLQTDLTTAEGAITTLETDLGIAETAIITLEANKEDTANKATDFTVVDDIEFPTTQAVDTKIDVEIVEQIKPVNPSQLGLKSDEVTIENLYLFTTNSVVDFTWNANAGLSSLPIYDSFSFNEASLIEKNRNKKWEMMLSCEATPAIISSPPSFLTGNITGSLILGYEHINLLQFESRLVYNVTTDIFEMKVFLTITQAENANTDPNPPVVGDPTLVAFFKFEESSALDTIIDLSEYGHNATVVDSATTDSTRVTGIVGNALQINSNTNTSRFTCANTADLNVAGNTPVTVMTWVRIVAANIGTSQLIGIFEKGGVRLTKTAVDNFEFRINGDFALRAISGAVVGDTWYHVAGTFSGTTSVKIYVNGVLPQNSTITPTSLNDSATDMQVAGTANALRTGNRLDELRFYKRELDAAEILSIYEAELP